MAVVKNLMVRAGADFSAIVAQSKKASNSMQKMGSTISKASGTISKALGALGVAVSLAAIVSAAKNAASAYKDQAEAEMKLAQVMQNTMGATASEIQAIKDLCSAQQQLGVIGDEVQIAGAKQLAMFSSETSSLKSLIPVMNDLTAAQYGLSATQENAATIATALGKAMQGNTTSLAKMGITFSDAEKKILQYGTEAERAAVLTKAVEGTVGGMNSALANTPLGRIQQLKNVLGDIKEQFGQAVVTIAATFVPLLNTVANGLAKIASWANAAAQAIANVFGKKMTNTSTAAGAGVSDAYDDIADSATSAGTAAKKASKNILGFDELNKLSDNSSSSSSGTSSSSSSSGTSIGSISYEADESAESLTWLEQKLASLQSWVSTINFEPLKTAFSSLKEPITELLTVLGENWQMVWDNVLAPFVKFIIEDTLPLVITGLGKVITWLGILERWVGRVLEFVFDKVDWLRENLPGIWEEVKEKASEVWSTIYFTIISIAKAIKEAVQEKVENIREKLAEIWEAIKQNTVEVFGALYSTIFATVLAIKESVQEKVELVQEKVKSAWDNVKTSTTNAWNTVKGKVESAWNNILAKVTSTKTTVEEKINEFKQNLSEKWDAIKQTVIDIWESIKSSIVDPVTEAASTAQSVIDGFVENLSNAWVTLRENTAGVFVGIYNTICGVIDAAWSYVSGIVESIRSAFSSVTEGAAGLGSSNRSRGAGKVTGVIGWASGGFPDTGSLFIARESGPEMVGTIGGQTAVVNNADIVASVSAGVYEAVISAMSSRSNDVRVYLDGTEMTNIITRNQHRNAYTMGY